MSITTDWLTTLATTTTSTEGDSHVMERLLRMAGFPKAVVVCGIVYPEGKGMTISIHEMARLILDNTGGKE